jgi:hypothetical protein
MGTPPGLDSEAELSWEEKGVANGCRKFHLHCQHWFDQSGELGNSSRRSLVGERFADLLESRGCGWVLFDEADDGGKQQELLKRLQYLNGCGAKTSSEEEVHEYSGAQGRDRNKRAPDAKDGSSESEYNRKREKEEWKAEPWPREKGMPFAPSGESLHIDLGLARGARDHQGLP